MNNYDPKDRANIDAMASDAELNTLKRKVFDKACQHRYSYNFQWLGRPIIQFPEDIVAIQEIIWDTKPELIVETGIAHGGSLVLSASLLQLIGNEGKVLGIDIDIRPHNREAIESHPLAHRIEMIEGSSIDPSVVEQVKQFAQGKAPVMVILDSNHTHEHVLSELRYYAPLVPKGSWLLVFDTVVEHMDEDAFPDRPWGVGNNPMTAVEEFLAESDRFELESEINNKLLLSVAPGGWLRCIKD